MVLIDGQYQSVRQFYAGKSVFITGGTGFLGKLFIEKLLYSCPEINKIYVLIREKKSMSSHQRIQEMTANVLFTRLREKRPEDLKKIIPIVGDVIAPKLGIKADDEQMLIEEVSVVIHSAATVRFNEPLKVAMKINFEGTVKVMNLCQRMKKIKALVHVSTAFTNTNRRVVEEKVYPPPAQLDDVFEFMKLYGDDERHIVKILNGIPNTYTFSKALAETYVKENHGAVPTVIIRPAVVTPALNEPLAGWVDNWNGSTALLHFIGKGYCRCLYSSNNHILDIIPVDYVCNLTLVAAARCNRSKEVTVFHSCSSSANPLLTRRLLDAYIKVCYKNGFNDFPFPWVLQTRRKWLIYIITLFTLTVPAYIADIWLFLRERPTRYVKILSVIVAARSAVDYFTSNSWVRKSTESQALYASLSAEDREVFPFDVADIDWDKYINIYFTGVKKYLLKSKL